MSEARQRPRNMDDERADNPAWSSSRRRFLGQLVAAGVGIPLFGPGTATALAETGQTVQVRVGPDGLPRSGFNGRYVGSNGSAVFVDSQGPAGIVRVATTPTTEVFAAGRRALGDVSGCNPGDDVDVGTYFANTSGARVARFINANAISYWLWLTSVSSESFTGETYGAMMGGSDLGASATCSIMPFTSFQPDEYTPSEGDYVFCGAFSQSPDSDRGTIWAVTVTQLVGE